MGLLKKDKLLRQQKLHVEKVDLGDGDFVYVREMTGRQRESFEKLLVNQVKNDDGSVRFERSLDDFRAKYAASVMCDENGENLLEPGDYKELSQYMSAVRLEKIVVVAERLNKITEEEKEKLVKNLSAGPAGNFSLDSAVS